MADAIVDSYELEPGQESFIDGTQQADLDPAGEEVPLDINKEFFGKGEFK